MKTETPAPKTKRSKASLDAKPVNERLRWMPWTVLAFAILMLLSSFREKKPATDLNVTGFGELPVLTTGRIQPFDSAARNSLLIFRGKQSLYDPAEKRTLSAMEWLLEVMMKPRTADTRPAFRVDDKDVKILFGITDEKQKFISFRQIEPKIDEMEKQVRQAAGTDEGKRTLFQRDVLKLHKSLVLYRGLQNSLAPQGVQGFPDEIALFQTSLAPGLAAVHARAAKEKFDEKDLGLIVEFTDRYKMLSQVAGLNVVPPSDSAKRVDEFENVGQSLLNSIVSRDVHPALLRYARMTDAYQKSDSAAFNREVADHRSWLAQNFPQGLKKARSEQSFNRIAPFYQAMILYVGVFLLACASWLTAPQSFGRAAYWLLLLTFVVHTAGLIFRMVLEDRPPVTNLYSSAVFIGWGSVVLGIILERIYRNGIGSAVAGGIGFGTLIIAHHLAMTGDTMEMMRAVLDSNFWLATHVVIITIGYSATYLAGFLAIIYVVRGLFTSGLDAGSAKSLERSVYGILCLATLFSFVGTVLGGIWADQSWGRFWGWDPKENGALLIVLWNALILHARWGGLVRQRGIMACAIFGNIITSLSWFGVNMLGVGLHSYGFIDAAFYWLAGFSASQVLLILLAILPLRFWRSFRGSAGASAPPIAEEKPEPVPA